MPENNEERIHLDIDEARALCEAALRGIGYDDKEAWIIGDHLIDAALCGYEYSGLPKLLNILDNPNFKAPRQAPHILRQDGPATMIDGGNNTGMLALHYATTVAIERAAADGVALVGVTNAWMSGRSAYFVEMIARARLVGIHTVSAGPMVAPLGGTKPMLGTNPIAFGFPMEPDPLVFDMGTSAFMGTDMKFRERLGIPLPDGVALDADGRPTTDAAAARKGALLPFGGHKGFGMALAMHALGLLCTPSPDDGNPSGYLFIAFKPDLFLPADDFRRALADWIAAIKATPRQDGVAEIRIPGERAYRDRARLKKDGITVDKRIRDALQRLAK